MSDEETDMSKPTGGVPKGTQLNGIYEIDELIALGGMGEVYRGHNIQTGDVVAIKIVLPEFAKDETILALFRKEASILNHLSSDAIVRYHVFTVDPVVGRPYLAMEYVEGESLAERIKSGPVPLEETRRMIAGVADGLSAAHKAGIIHRDLSPDNIILSGGSVDNAKIIDFGIAKSAGVGGGTLLGGKFAGKYNFVSPEQLGLFGGEITERSDIYAIGLVLAASLMGRALNMTGSQVDVVEKRRVVPDISAIDVTVRPIVEAMLQPNPADRPPNMSTVADWLRRSGTSTPPQINPAATAAAETVIAAPLPTQTSDVSQIGGSVAPHNPTSVNPFASPVSQVAHPSVAPVSQPPMSQPPAAQQPVPHQPASFAPQAVAPAPKSKSGLIAGAVAALVLIGGGGAYFSGALDGLIGNNNSTGNNDRTSLTPATPKTPDKPIETTTAPPVTPTKPLETTPDPKEVEEVSTALSSVADIAAWVNDYDGGKCFYAKPMNVSASSLTIEGYASSGAPFEKMEKQFKALQNFEPQIQLRQIVDAQCAVAEFIQNLKKVDGANPSLTLSSTNVKSGQSLRGTLGDLGSRKTFLYLVDNDGVVYSLGSYLKRDGENGKFNIKLVDLATRNPLPQLIMTITTPDTLSSAILSSPALAMRLFPRIMKEIKANKVRVGASIQFFKLGG